MDAIKLFTQYQVKLAEVLTGTKVYVSGGRSDEEVRKNGMKANDELKILSEALHAALQTQNNELTQSKARIRELKRAISNEIIDICDACAGREDEFHGEIEEIQFDEGLFEWVHLPKEDSLEFYKCKSPRLANALSEKSDKEK